jgi:regulator of ribosome biosynthesis
MPDVEMEDASTVSPSDQLVENHTTATAPLPVTVSKPIPHTYDLGNLLLSDANPLPDNSPATLTATARECAQSLVNQLLTVCTVTSTDAGVHLTLPAPSTPLPREKPVPKEKEKTKWERFAAKKGIKAKKKDGKLVYNETTGEWVPKYGYKGANKAGESDWMVEVDAEKEQRTGEAGDARREKRAERKEKVRRQERRQRANERHGNKGTG